MRQGDMREEREIRGLILLEPKNLRRGETGQDVVSREGERFQALRAAIECESAGSDANDGGNRVAGIGGLPGFFPFRLSGADSDFGRLFQARVSCQARAVLRWAWTIFSMSLV